jgi:hypothetical protein
MWLDAGVIFAPDRNNPAEWTAANIGDAIDALNRVSNAIGDGVLSALGLGGGGTLTFYKISGIAEGGFHLSQQEIQIWLRDGSREQAVETFIHEIGHVVDGRAGVLGQYYSTLNLFWQRHHFANPSGAVSRYAVEGGPNEDFAETFKWWVEDMNGNQMDFPIWGPNPNPDPRGTPDNFRRAFVQTTVALAVNRFW